MPHPHKDIDYAVYTLPSPMSIQLGSELFTNQFRCSLSLFISSLRNTINELINRGHTLKALPIISLFEHASSQLARSVPYTVLARVFRAEALVGLSRFGDAVQVIKGLIIGADLPMMSSVYHSTPDTLGGNGFNDQLPLNNPKNIKILSLLIDKTLSPSLIDLYGHEATSALILAKSRLLIKLASTCSDIMSYDLFVSSRNHDNRSCSLTSVLSHSSLSMSMSTSSTNWAKAAVKDKDVTRPSVKMALLEHSERTLAELLKNSTGMYVYMYMYNNVLST